MAWVRKVWGRCTDIEGQTFVERPDLFPPFGGCQVGLESVPEGTPDAFWVEEAKPESGFAGFVFDVVVPTVFGAAFSAVGGPAAGAVGGAATLHRTEKALDEQHAAVARAEAERADLVEKERAILAEIDTMNGNGVPTNGGGFSLTNFLPAGIDFGQLLGQGLQALVTYKANKDAQQTALRVAAMNAPAPTPVGASATMPQFPGIALPTGGFSLPSILGFGRAAAGAAGAVVGGAVRVAAGIVRGAAGFIRGVMVGGRFVSSSKAIALARKLGPTAAATALGITAAELAEMIVQDAVRVRRRMNPLNIRAARRAIRRIRSVRNVTASIERDVVRSLPPRRARISFSRGSPGRITRREAARALRK